MKLFSSSLPSALALVLTAWSHAALTPVRSAQTQSAAPTTVHELSTTRQAPGVVAFHALIANPQWAMQIQPVRINVPAEGIVSIWGGSSFVPATSPAPVVGLSVGPVARFQVQFTRDEKAYEVFPSVELIGRLTPPPGLELRFPVEVVLSTDDLIQASEGRMVTRVVYLENPETALPFRQEQGEQRFVDVGDWEDPLSIAARLGRPMAIVRLGSRIPTPGEMDQSFHFGGAPLQEFPQQFFEELPGADQPDNSALPPTNPVQPVAWQEQGSGLTAPNQPERMSGLPALAVSAPISADGNSRMTDEASLPRSTDTPRSLDSIPAAEPLCNPLGSEPMSVRFVGRSEQTPDGPMSYPDSICQDVQSPGIPFQADWNSPSACPPPAPWGSLPSAALPWNGMSQDGSGNPCTTCPPMLDDGCGNLFRFSVPVSKDELVCDGDDRELEVLVDQNWRVYGLDTEDTIGHFDTLDGRRLVVPSNRTCIYSPRFAAIRKVSDFVAESGATRLVQLSDRNQMQTTSGSDFSSTTLQQLMPGHNVGGHRASGLSDHTRGVLADQVVQMSGLRNGFSPFEDLQLMRFGHYEASESTRLQLGRQSAGVWQANDGMQVIVDKHQPVVVNDVLGAQELVTVNVGDGKTLLRVCKLASKIAAQPGESIEFTIRFDNVGAQLIGNVTIIDSLTPRLEFVSDSAECSLQGNFRTERNEADSLVLRWEVTDPLKPGEGGLIRFRCIVR